jgi:carnitine O-palmitoyltransferase 2
MLRRSVIKCEASSFPNVPDLKDWTRLGDQMKAKTIGRCFDKTVLDRSIIPTRHFQKSLFRLPIPKLEDTCKKYLGSVQPLVTPDAFKKTTDFVNTFQSGVGKDLHEALIARDKKNTHTSYISDDWFDLYLRDRQALPINYNPFLVTRFDPDKPDGILRAAFWIASSVRWRKMYAQNILKPEIFWFGSKDMYCRQEWFLRTIRLCPESISAKALAIGSKFHAFPLDMSQYDSLFNSTRLPRRNRDEIQRVKFAKHIVVAHRGHYYKVDVADDNENPLPEEQIYARLKAIEATNAAPAQVDIGWFTGDNRDQWTDARITLERDPLNKHSLETIDTALFVVCLDTDTDIHVDNSEGVNKASMQFMAQDINRWWDKSFQVIFSKNGAACVNFEHSWGDGVAILRYSVDIFNDSISRSAKTMNRNAPATAPVEQLGWNLDYEPRLVDAAKKAQANLRAQINRVDFFSTVVDCIGKKDPVFSGSKVKPDPFMQVMIQLAWWRLNKSTVSTYESASTAAFLKGRTECIRSATNETQKFTLAFDKPDVSDQDKYAMLIAATEKHAAVSKDAKMGSGVDRHLFALRKDAERAGGKLPDIFSDPSYTTFGSNILSTSSLFSEALIGGGFGPVSPGYGIGYAADDSSLVFNISSWKTGGPSHSSEDFARAVYASSQDMANLIRRVEGKK